MLALALGLALLAGAVPELDPRQTLTVTYIGNCGYIVEAQGAKIAIDALFGGKPSEYYDIPSDSIVARMKAAQPPFDHIDLIAVTHWHHDHFNAAIVAKHLVNNPECMLLCPQQVADRLVAEPDYAAFAQRIHPLNMPVDSVASYRQTGISARVFSSHHGSYLDTDSIGETVDIHRNTQNLEYLIALGNHTIFHCGDARFQEKYRYQRFGMGRDSIDAAFVQWWECNDLPSFGELIVREELLPRRIFFTHLAPGRGASWAKQPACASHKGVTFPTHCLESWIIELEKR